MGGWLPSTTVGVREVYHVRVCESGGAPRRRGVRDASPLAVATPLSLRSPVPPPPCLPAPVPPDYEDSAVQDFLEILEEHRRNCERQGKYTEAEVARTRLEELRMHEENRRKEAMRSRQVMVATAPKPPLPSSAQSNPHLAVASFPGFACCTPARVRWGVDAGTLCASPCVVNPLQIAERLGVEEAYKLEYEQFKMAWDRKIAEYDENAGKLVVAMKVGVAPVAAGWGGG